MEPNTLSTGGHRVRLNVTREGTLIALAEGGAIVQLPITQLPERQTTLAIQGPGGMTLHLPARVVRSVPLAGPPAYAQHYVTLAFLDLAPETSEALRRVIDPAPSATLHL